MQSFREATKSSLCYVEILPKCRHLCMLGKGKSTRHMRLMVQPINSAAFAIAMSGSEARLYISWKHNELDCYMRKVDSFLLQKPNDYLKFRKYVRNIIDWGKGKRLNEIRDSLDSLLEESKTRTSEAAKSRQPPSNDSATSSSKRQKSSPSPRNSSRPSSVQGHEPYWELDDTVRRWFHRNADGTFKACP